jgi:hypothetical protein
MYTCSLLRPWHAIFLGTNVNRRLGTFATSQSLGLALTSPIFLDKYPVHPSFDHWRFPHDRLPRPWSDLEIPPGRSTTPFKQSLAATGRDMSCRISGYRDAVEVAHIVPLSAGKWFDSNAMERYCRHAELNPVDDERNLLLLRRDIHYLMDQRRFALIPKTVPAGDLSQLAIHVLNSESAELVCLYHNRAPQTIKDIPVELLLARFAWSIFTDNILTLFKGSQEYAVLSFDLKSGKHVTRRMFSPQIRNISSLFGSYSRSRSVSPRKRNVDELSQHALAVNDDINDFSLMVDQLVSGQCHGKIPQEQEPRGRRRKRSWQDVENSPPDLANSATSVATSSWTADADFSDETAAAPDRKAHELVSLVGMCDEPPRKR